ncbi:hypothetical protein PQ469_02035 [Mucilaginibacter sp. KACC 22773]|jgi:hypothetical protein|uniref:hypothetical protein n=1 Tax=Mucilaginibacter sp. KACC 22773 TaxID=3025671 RepID=UPI0023660BC9|nr:hypothetical protein [Mucilaginibacter sp. KACC 22773]WDF78785.1 hypothetical protein PQ469_02035 [Mucilaginibacter sp. KACC 22773]
MNTFFLLTHITMAVCMFAIIYTSALKDTNPHTEIKQWLALFASFKLKPIRLTRLQLYRAAIGLITIIMR